MLRRLFIVVTLLAAAVSAGAAEQTRVLRGELTASPAQPWTIENLAGTMTVVPGGGDRVTASVTVHAESAALAEAVRFEQVVGKKGEPTLRVIYPRDHWTFLYPGGGNSNVEYDDRKVKVSSRHGVEVWAEVRVEVPRTAVSATFRNVVGRLSAEGIEGKMLLDTGSGDIEARNLSGEILTDTGSGTVRGEKIKGTYGCDTGSGDCLLDGFEGDEVKADTGSGTVRLSHLSARRVVADTGSGDVAVDAEDIEELRADTGSGSVRLTVAGSRLRRVTADTGSGDVTLRLPADASFDARADQGSGDLICNFADAKPLVVKREVVGYTRGDGRITIRVDTGSGDLRIVPAS